MSDPRDRIDEPLEDDPLVVPACGHASGTVEPAFVRRPDRVRAKANRTGAPPVDRLAWRPCRPVGCRLDGHRRRHDRGRTPRRLQPARTREPDERTTHPAGVGLTDHDDLAGPEWHVAVAGSRGHPAARRIGRRPGRSGLGRPRHHPAAGRDRA